MKQARYSKLISRRDIKTSQVPQAIGESRNNAEPHAGRTAPARANGSNERRSSVRGSGLYQAVPDNYNEAVVTMWKPSV